MKIPSTDAFDRKFQELIKAGEELAGLKALLDVHEIHPRHFFSPHCAENWKRMRDFLNERKEETWNNIAAKLAAIEEMMEE